MVVVEKAVNKLFFLDNSKRGINDHDDDFKPKFYCFQTFFFELTGKSKNQIQFFFVSLKKLCKSSSSSSLIMIDEQSIIVFNNDDDDDDHVLYFNKKKKKIRIASEQS